MADIKKALVLSGGSIKGAFQAGAIQYVLENTGFVPDAIYGVSVGSLNGAFLADRAGRSAAPDWPQLGNDLEAFWRQRITTFSDLGKKRGTFSLVLKIVRNKFNGLIKMDASDALIRSTMDAGNIRKSPAKFFAGIVDIETSEFFNADVEGNPDDFIDYVIASTREPIIMPNFKVGDRQLVDGGLRNIAPLGSAIDAGADEIYVISNQSEAAKHLKENFKIGKITDLASRVIAILTNEIVNNDLKGAEKINKSAIDLGLKEKGAKIPSGPHEGKRLVDFTLIRPAMPIGISVTDFDSKDIDSMLKLGKARAKEAIDNKLIAGPPS